jgi:hypothetical protein
MIRLREIMQSVARLSWAISLVGFRELTGILASRGLPSREASPAGVGEVSTSISPARGYTGDERFTDVSAAAKSGDFESPSPGSSAQPTGGGRLDTSRMMVLGEGLAAGVGDFALSSTTQPWSFAAQIAHQTGASFPLPLIQPPGIGDFPGFPRLSVRVTAPLQTTVLGHLPPARVSNLAVPGFHLSDAVTLRPNQPLIDRSDAKQSAANLIWGVLPIVQGKSVLPTQLEYALEQSPTFTIVELGYYEALEAAVSGNPRLLPQRAEFISHYSHILSSLAAAGSQVLVLNIPDPFDTAHFSSIDVAAKIARVEASFIRDRYGIGAEDVITLSGLNDIGFQVFSRSLEALHPDSSIGRQVADEIRKRIAALNLLLAELTQRHGGIVYDLAGLIRRTAADGYRAGARHITGEYLGGFYALNGYYPGQTGQAIIANEIIQLLNATWGTSLALVDVNAVMSSDPAAACRPAGGPIWPAADLWQLPFNADPEVNEAAFETARADDRESSDAQDTWNQLAPLSPPAPPRMPLELPPGLHQELPLNPSASYFGDGISALQIRNPREAQFGSTADFIFGGLAMVDSHLNGSVGIDFTPPVDGVSHFTVSFMGGFIGADSVLMAPRFFKMGFQQNRVDEVPGLISSGDLNLQTGEVANLAFFAAYSSTALQALISVNPNFPQTPITFKNPPPSNCPPPTPEQQRIYASAWAEFDQRPDGKLDFTFYGSMFAPLGPGASWPLNFAGPSREHATIPASGTVMHPHLQISTKRDGTKSKGDVPDRIPFNTIQEFTLFTHSSAFGDSFQLNVPQLGGPATGRSHLLGRLQLQFGPKTQNSVPVAIFGVPPGGVMAPMAASPITTAFPSRLSPGPQGFNENLRFPLRNYPLDDLSVVDDPFDISVGALDLRNGRFLNSLLHRAFISQDLIFALLRVEPCTPQSSFFFRGPAVLVKGPRDQNVFRFQGIVHIPYPAGLKFPLPNFSTGFTVGPNSALDPFLWFHAIQSGNGSGVVKEGGGTRIRASTGDVFSYRYIIGADASQTTPLFEYENHTQEGSFCMHSVAWIDFSNSGTSSHHDHDYDTVTFSGFGIWSKDQTQTIQQAAVQICTSAEKPYVGIQIASGDVSNVNTKPPLQEDALP